jgi:hypothetical protein
MLKYIVEDFKLPSAQSLGPPSGAWEPGLSYYVGCTVHEKESCACGMWANKAT